MWGEGRDETRALRAHAYASKEARGSGVCGSMRTDCARQPAGSSGAERIAYLGQVYAHTIGG